MLGAELPRSESLVEWNFLDCTLEVLQAGREKKTKDSRDSMRASEECVIPGVEIFC
jgi:hypothetical protein